MKLLDIIKTSSRRSFVLTLQKKLIKISIFVAFDNTSASLCDDNDIKIRVKIVTFAEKGQKYATSQIRLIIFEKIF